MKTRDKYLFIVLFFVNLTQPGWSNELPKNDVEILNLEKSLVESVLWENYWEGRWSKRGYWKNDQIDYFLSKNIFKATVVPRQGGLKKSEWLELYVDDLRTIFSFLKDGDYYIFNGEDDSWFSETQREEYYEYKKNHSEGSKIFEFQIRNKYRDVIKKQKKNPEKCKKVSEVIDKVVLNSTKLEFIKEYISTKSVKKLHVTIGTLWNDYPYIYYRIKNLDRYGVIAFNPVTNKIYSENYFSRDAFADKKYHDNLVKKIDREGEKFIAVDGKLKCN